MPTGTQDPTKVSIGFTTKAATGIGSTALAGAIVAFVTGDRSEQTLGVLTGAAVLVVTFAITAISRAAQARAQVQVQPQVIATISNAKAAERRQASGTLVTGGSMTAPPAPVTLDDVRLLVDARVLAAQASPPPSDPEPGPALVAEAQTAHDEAIAARSIEDDEPDLIDPLPHLPTTAPDDIGTDLGDPLSRGEATIATTDIPS